MKFCLSLIALVFASGFHASAEEVPRPNILYFYVDDMGWGSIGPNGQAARRAQGLPSVQTPNLDALAARGVNFTRAYGCTVCSPARSSQQTGYHQGHTFADRNDPDNAKKAIRTDDVTMGDALSEAGYATGYWGKWGYGGSKDMKNPVIQNVQTLPTTHGYTHVLTELHHVRAHTFFQPTLWSAPAKLGTRGGLELVANTMASFVGNAAYPTQPSNHDHPDYPDTAYCDDLYAFAALDFVRKQAQLYAATKQPFFGLLAVQIPHAPFDEVATLPGWDSAYAEDAHFATLDPQAQQWAAMVTRIDAHFGNLLAALEDPNGDGDPSDSISEDTLVIFMSDNGGPGGKNNLQLDANGGLRGNKGSIYEGGIRVPTIMRWPGKIAAGTTNDTPFDVTDLLPTFCELAGVDRPLGLDGVSIAPTLAGVGTQRSRDFLIHEAGKHHSIIRGNHKLIRSNKERLLYDLGKNPEETQNVAKANPELVKELEAILLAERVTEPRGFANTYHEWIGDLSNPGSLSDPQNWSDYVYENEGIVYLEDKGAPQRSWIANLHSTSTSPAKLIADQSLEVLGFEISGAAPMDLIVGEKIQLTGRNEIRVSANGILTLDGGTLSSLRWTDVREGGTIQGTGAIEGELYNAGEVSLAKAGIEVDGAYIQAKRARLHLENANAVLAVSDRAELSGLLTVSDTFQPDNDSVTVISARSIQGRFSNLEDLVRTSGGRMFKIRYSPTAVMLRPVEEAPSTGRFN